jgi:hypothetical protein
MLYSIIIEFEDCYVILDTINNIPVDIINK